MSGIQPSTSISQYISLLKDRKPNFVSTTANPNPTVSLVSSFFNADRYFETTYKSLLDQTWQDLEWIIVDDCSTAPEAIALFQSLSTRTPKIKTVQRQINGGLAAGRNTAIAQATGKYLFFMDLDDIIDPTYIEKCVLFLETHPEFSFVNSYSVGFQAQEYWWEYGFTKPAQFIQQNWVTAMLMYRKMDFDRLGGFDENLKFYEDWERWLRAIAHQQKGWTIPEYLHCYRRTDDGLLLKSRNNIDEEERVTQLLQLRYEKFFQENNVSEPFIRRISAFDVEFKNYKFAVKNLLNRPNWGKRILCFFPWLEVGGADKFNLDLLNQLNGRGYEITIATTVKSDHPWHKYFYSLTPDIFHLPNYLDDSHWLAFTRYIIESRQIDLVLISNCYLAYYFLPFLRLEFPQVAFVDFVHTVDPGLRQWGYPRISCKLTRLLDCQIVASQYLAGFDRTLNPETENKLRVCYINIDADKWQFSQEKREKLRSQLNIADDAAVILFPARIVFQKRPLLLVEIVKELVSQSLPVAVITLGGGELFAQMQAKIAQLDLQSVFYNLPSAEPEQMVDFYSAADILLLPSEYEGISLAIYEAMSMQLPVVAADVGGQSELVTPETGFLVPKGNSDTEEVRAYLNVLIPLIQNPNLRRQIGCLARQRVAEYFPLSAMGDRMEAIFAEAIQLRQAAPQPEVDLDMAAETLTLALEYFHQEQALGNLWQEKCQLEKTLKDLRQEKEKLDLGLHNLWQEKCQLEQENMKLSKYWKFKRLWHKFKHKLGLTRENS
jgi:glycosyltransferase involved in cell wall biosynthesis